MFPFEETIHLSNRRTGRKPSQNHPAPPITAIQGRVLFERTAPARITTGKSPGNIHNGARWRDEVAEKLKASDFGIICLTPENLGPEWLLFEAGAPSKAVDACHVCPMLIDLAPSEVSRPLAQFQATRAKRHEIRNLLRMINAALGTRARPDQELDEAFDVWWSKLETELNEIPLEITAHRPERSDRQLLEGILAIVRDQARAKGPAPNVAPPLTKSLAVDSFESRLRRDLEALPGICRAQVDVSTDRYRVSIDPEPLLTGNSKYFEFLWDEEPLNSTRQRALEAVQAYIAELKAQRAVQSTSYANEDTPTVARFRSEFLK